MKKKLLHPKEEKIKKKTGLDSKKILPITSPHNPTYKKWVSLTSSHGIKKEGLLLLSGEKIISDLGERFSTPPLAEIVPPQGQPLSPNFSEVWSGPVDWPVYEVPQDLFDRLDVMGTHFNLLVLPTPPIPEDWNPEAPPIGLEILTPLSDPSNLGALIRSALAFGASRIVLLESSANPFLPRSLKASSGTALRAPLVRALPKDLLGLKTICGPKVLLNQTLRGKTLPQFSWPPHVRLLLGEEGQGLRRLFPNHSNDLQDAHLHRNHHEDGHPENFQENWISLSIPMDSKGVESLNATTAASIAMYSWFTARNSQI